MNYYIHGFLIKEKYNKLIYYIEQQKMEIIVSPFLKDTVVKVQQFLLLKQKKDGDLVDLLKQNGLIKKD